MPCRFWYLTLHFTRSVAMRQLLSDILANDISHTGNTRRRWLPMTPTYSSRPSMNCSTIAGVRMVSWMYLTRLMQLLFVGDHRRLRDADRRLVGQRLHDHRVAQPLRQHRLAVERHDREVRRRNAVIREELPRQRLVARQRQAARIAAGVRHAQQLEIADDVLVEHADVGKRLHQVEDDGRLELVDGLADRRQVVVHADDHAARGRACAAW